MVSKIYCNVTGVQLQDILADLINYGFKIHHVVRVSEFVIYDDHSTANYLVLSSSGA